jgi:hypothetical protein
MLLQAANRKVRGREQVSKRKRRASQAVSAAFEYLAPVKPHDLRDDGDNEGQVARKVIRPAPVEYFVRLTGLESL